MSNYLNKIFLLVKIGLMILGWVCSLPSNLIELIQVNTTLKEELKQYEGEFEWDEFLDL